MQCSGLGMALARAESSKTNAFNPCPVSHLFGVLPRPPATRTSFALKPNFKRNRGTLLETKATNSRQLDAYGVSIADDYYAVLGVMPDATPAEIKRAYYNCMKACHPDLSGDDTETTNFCTFVNEVYEVLSDPVQRMVYDEIHGYAYNKVNPFLDKSQPKDHVFVDEFRCIGCKNCANLAPDVFTIEEEFGRARAYCPKGDHDEIKQAVESCPVDCIHWTTAAQLSLLEDEMRKIERINVGLMLSSMGFITPDVFTTASTKWEKRQRMALERARLRMMKEKPEGKEKSYWDGLWNEGYNSTTRNTDDIRERASRAAAAARRWREYSRKGADRRPTCSLPTAKSAEERKEAQGV